MTHNSTSRRSPEVLVPFFGLIYFVLVMFYVMVSTNFAPFSLIFIPFIVLFLLGAYGVWRRNRFGFIASIVLSALFLVLESNGIANALSAMTVPSEFLSAITGVPILVAVLIYSILGLRLVWRKGMPLKPSRMIPASSVVFLLILGFIVGGIAIGLVAGQTESRLVSSSASGDITIVQGAGNQNNGQFFSPSSFTVKAGTTVTWVNHDGATHTVTSKGSSSFDSGNVPTGGVFSYKFTQPGTYEYYCTLHPWMTGTVVVTSG